MRRTEKTERAGFAAPPFADFLLDAVLLIEPPPSPARQSDQPATQ